MSWLHTYNEVSFSTTQIQHHLNFRPPRHPSIILTLSIDKSSILLPLIFFRTYILLRP